jgi:hypothetical protein
MNIDILASLSTEVLEAALAKAREREAEREAEELKARWPKCKCGKPITQVCYPLVSYVFRNVYERAGRATIGCELAHEQDIAPGESDIDDNVAWGSCDDEGCEGSSWVSISFNDLSWG